MGNFTVAYILFSFRQWLNPIRISFFLLFRCVSLVCASTTHFFLAWKILPEPLDLEYDLTLWCASEMSTRDRDRELSVCWRSADMWMRDEFSIFCVSHLLRMSTVKDTHMMQLCAMRNRTLLGFGQMCIMNDSAQSGQTCVVRVDRRKRNSTN